MTLFPNCKINIGLDVLRKRPDGYHDIETVMYPVYGICDSLEIIRSSEAEAELTGSGLPVDCSPGDNLVMKAYRLLRAEYGIEGVKMHLHKNIPTGAGLGGGSSNAAFAVKALDSVFGLGLTTEKMESLCARLGSDVPWGYGWKGNTDRPAWKRNKSGNCHRGRFMSGLRYGNDRFP